MFEEGGDEIAEESFAMGAVTREVAELGAASCHGVIGVALVLVVWSRGSASVVLAETGVNDMDNEDAGL